ncbi:phenylalanine--tRNA ligase subunit beta [Candidatus Mycoplasma mahonii]|uniref:phenylalanine--tRNA ligase subunit beta n=1 Tax=Candidatus Mycoplasma mahonii TaxID=3004105 RepID=UPI0026F0E603|nr:phenylalanine--tRNA ligase subunit beta [Candidatus Mycoplasma mahonii]WKX02194.1 phenylalanine--tRNA ligase subunit beta [Candidatus Mycoplasma mahonii]
MIFSYNELKRLANLPNNITPEKMSDAINSIGFEVEESISFGNIEGVKFGKIIEIYKNPNGDKLTVTKIQFDDKERIIQTTAKNLENNRIVLALIPGSKLNGIEIQSKELKGIISEGMLTSISEIGIHAEYVRPEQHDMITLYEDNIDLSSDPVEYLGLKDTLFNIDILSNRSDARSYLIMAKELSGYFKTTQLDLSKNKSTLSSTIEVSNGSEKSLVLIEAQKDFKITIKEQIFLGKNKIKSISDIVDLTNLTLIMTGQPTHAYDKNNVGTKFKTSLSSEEVTVFGGKKIKLNNNIVITSDDKVVSVAGVIGLEDTAINKATKDFIIELGIFDIKKIRNSMKVVKLDTQASIQSSKNIGIGTTSLAIEYLSSKLKTFSRPINFIDKNQILVNYTMDKASSLAGFDITTHPRYANAISSLESLGFEFLENKVSIPTYRHDIESYQDLNEEIFRFIGYNSFEASKPQIMPTDIRHITDYKGKICAMGYNEVQTYSLISKELNNVNPFNFDNEIVLETFISKQREVIKYSQAITLLSVIDYNQKRGIKDISIFSKSMIGDGIQTFGMASTTKSFLNMKRDAIQLLPKGATFKRTYLSSLHNGVSATIELNGNMIGWIGKVHPSLTNVDAYIVELILNNKNYSKKIIPYNDAPLKSRDITFELKEGEEIGNFIKNINATEINVIDEFKQGELNKVTVKLILTDKQINELG